jgi:hypothetical protein
MVSPVNVYLFDWSISSLQDINPVPNISAAMNALSILLMYAMALIFFSNILHHI